MKQTKMAKYSSVINFLKLTDKVCTVHKDYLYILEGWAWLWVNFLSSCGAFLLKAWTVKLPCLKLFLVKHVFVAECHKHFSSF